MAVSERVSAERGESLGETVSPLFPEMYQNRNKCSSTENTSITTFLLRK
jgi:hypothetical protein